MRDALLLHVVHVCVLGDCVLAEWKDERYYPATVVSVASNGVDVKFTDGTTMSVQQQNLVKCSRIPVGCTVLARADESAWYEPAVIKSYYADADSLLRGYVVLFADQTAVRYSFVVFLLSLEFFDDSDSNYNDK